MRLSLGALWPEGRSSSSVSQFLPTRFWSACPMAVRWKDGYRGDLSPWLFFQLCFCSVWGRCPAERGGQTQRCAQLSARLSAELCSPVLWRYCTTLRCTESIRFLWPLNRKFSGLLVRPWISSAVADGTVFAWLVLEGVMVDEPSCIEKLWWSDWWVGGEHEQFCLSKIELKVMVHHPARNVTQTGCNASSYRRIIWLEWEVELSVISIAVVGKAMLLNNRS